MREKITFVVKNNVWVCILILKHKNPKRNVSRGEYLIIVKKSKSNNAVYYMHCIQIFFNRASHLPISWDHVRWKVPEKMALFYVLHSILFFIYLVFGWFKKFLSKMKDWIGNFGFSASTNPEIQRSLDNFLTDHINKCNKFKVMQGLIH